MSGLTIRRIGVAAGPILAVLVWALLPDAYAGPDGKTALLGTGARSALAMMAWMATWWMTEAVEIEVTALFPLVVFPLAGVASFQETAFPYASDVVFLFLGGFVLALAVERWGLARRIALWILRLAGTRPAGLVAGFMAATASLSLFISNTATAAMMVPIAIGVIDLLGKKRSEEDPALRNFAVALLLAIAYSASIGGVGTLVGTPPNGILVRFILQTTGKEVSFAGWMLIGMPFVVVFLPLAWLLLTRVLYPCRLPDLGDTRAFIEEELRGLGALGRGERTVLGVLGATIGLWMLRPLLVGARLGGSAPLAGLTDGGVAMLAALALFLAPVDLSKGIRAMDWKTATRLPWGVLVLFGGGLSLAAAIESTGAAAFLAAAMGNLRGLPAMVVVAAVTTATVFLSEVTSNTAQVALMLPILAALAPSLGTHPFLLMVPCTLGASSAYMMPVGTPPNAIVFGTGKLRIGQMVRAGFWLNLAGIVVIVFLTRLVVAPLLGVEIP